MRLFSLFFFFSLSNLVGAQDLVFQGRVDLARSLVSFETNPPVKGTLYLLAGAASAVRLVSEEPFVAEVEFVQAEWKGESDLTSYRTILRFEGAEWAKKVVVRKPRLGGDDLIYPYRKFQVAALPSSRGFTAFAVTALY